MSITASYRRITLQEFAEFQSNPEVAQSFFNLDLLSDFDFYERYFNLEKDWHALHFLLTGESDLTGGTRTELPLYNVVQGGTPTQLEATYGFVRYLNPDEVRAVAQALSRISTEDLRQRFDPAAFNAAKIYPNPRPGGWDKRQIETLFELYPQLVKFFQDAAMAGEIVLLSSN